jgi:hypothetical protein
VGVRIFTSLCRPDRLWGPPSLLSNGYRELTTHLQLVPRSRKYGSNHPLPHTSSWCSRLLVKHGEQLYLYLYRPLTTATPWLYCRVSISTSFTTNASSSLLFASCLISFICSSRRSCSLPTSHFNVGFPSSLLSSSFL